jgi:ketosteroid isomerase-like protein
MSQGNVELAYEGLDAFNRRDLDAFLALADADVEFVSLLAPVEGGTYRGHDGIRRMWENTAEVFPDLIAEIVEVRELGDVMFGAVHFRAHGAGSDVPLDWTVWYAARWRGGRCVSVHSFETKTEALQAAGLSE